MGRGRVELKRIENKINRQVSFSKRRTGLLKKAHEISVLCDADVALIVFSPKGNLIQFSSDSCMERILERYERYSFAAKQLSGNHTEPSGSWAMEHAKLKARIEVLQKNQKNFMGEEIESLSVKELQILEHQIESALKHVRSRKNHAMSESISELEKKDKALQEQNNLLMKKIKEKEKKLVKKAQIEQQSVDQDSSSNFTLPIQSLNISVSFPERDGGIEEEEEGQAPQRLSNGNANTHLLPWM